MYLFPTFRPSSGNPIRTCQGNYYGSDVYVHTYIKLRYPSASTIKTDPTFEAPILTITLNHIKVSFHRRHLTLSDYQVKCNPDDFHVFLATNMSPQCRTKRNTIAMRKFTVDNTHGSLCTDTIWRHRKSMYSHVPLTLKYGTITP